MTESTWSAGEPFEHTDRFTWERIIRDPKVGMPRETLGAALLLATYSTGKTGRDIKVSEAALRDVLGYDDERCVRRLLAELRDDLGLILRAHRGNQHRPTEHALVIPNDLLDRAERLRSKRLAEALRKAKHRTQASGADDDAGNVHRTPDAGAPDAARKSTGHRRPTTKGPTVLPNVDQGGAKSSYGAELESVAPAPEATDRNGGTGGSDPNGRHDPCALPRAGRDLPPDPRTREGTDRICREMTERLRQAGLLGEPQRES